MVKSILFISFLLLLLFSCRRDSSSNNAPQNHPLSNRDPKVTLSPDERFGALFDSVALSDIFGESKTFADWIPLTTTDSIIEAFNAAQKLPNFSLQMFVYQYFTPDLNHTKPYQTDPSRSAEEHIIGLYSILQRAPDTADLSSQIPLWQPYLVADGRAREMTYWSSYFTMLGLQAAGRVDLMENMVENFAQLINTEGYIPSGTRTYYRGQSQPPFFACMVQLLADAKQDESVLKKYLPQLEREYKYWMDGAQDPAPSDIVFKNHVVQVDRNTLNRYHSAIEKPRVDAYRADHDSVRHSIHPPSETYRQIRAASESGWLFSSRWFDNFKDFSTIHAADIVPIDLNALMYNLELTISKGKVLEKKYNEATDWEKKASRRREALMRYCWAESKGMFFDFDAAKYKQTEVISAAMAYPLFFKMVTKRDADRVVEAIKTHLLKAGGILATDHETGQLWDAPNGFAPLQWLTIKGLRNYGHEELAADVKSRWVNLNLKIYKQTGRMQAKYNVENPDAPADDAARADGFGSTNGVLLRLLTEN